MLFLKYFTHLARSAGDRPNKRGRNVLTTSHPTGPTYSPALLAGTHPRLALPLQTTPGSPYQSGLYAAKQAGDATASRIREC